MKYDVLTAVLSLPPLHVGQANISQKLNRQGIRSADHWHTEHSPDRQFQGSRLIDCLVHTSRSSSSLNSPCSHRRLAAVLILKLCVILGRVVNARPRPLYPREQGTSAGSHRTGGWVGLSVQKIKKICVPTGCRISNRSIVVSRCTDYAMSPLFPCMPLCFTRFLLFADE